MGGWCRSTSNRRLERIAGRSQPCLSPVVLDHMIDPGPDVGYLLTEVDRTQRASTGASEPHRVQR